MLLYRKHCCLFIYRFPKDESLRQAWIRATRRKEFVPSKNTFLCSKHFRECDIDRTSVSCVRLRCGAVPSVFDAFPKHLQKNYATRKSPKKRHITEVNAHPTDQPDLVNPGEGNTAVQTESPEKKRLKRKLEDTKGKLTRSRKKVKMLQQSNRRLAKRNGDLQSIITELKHKAFISEQSIAVLENCTGGVADLLKRQVAKHSNQPMKTVYSPELRSFALTLNFYSPHAYRYVRKMFDTCLPHPRTVQKWYQSVDVRPGFTEPAFTALKLKADAAADEGKPMLCSLVMDEMALRQHVEWDGKKYQGYIDMGTELDDDSLPVAKECLTFLVVAINGSWKLPVGYFMIAGLGAMERANLVQQCITKLHAVGVSVTSLTFDGAATNLSMMQRLGCKLDCNNIKSWFSHPVTEQPVNVFLDACHMLKLVRNSIADKNSFIDGQGHHIRWRYVEELHKLQEREGLHLGNKLRGAHIEFFKKKMNVKLAAQLLSESVAKSLQYCLDEKISEEFNGCEATIKFISVFNALFDVLNSRNLCSNGYKVPLQNKNANEVMQFLKETTTYIQSLKLADGLSILKSNRKTGFVGFLICIESLQNMYERLIACPDPPLNFLKTYKMSQDHVELFFGRIRSMGGCNNNPTSRQFTAAYKKLLVHNDIQDVLNGNSQSLASVPILTASSNYLLNINSSTPSAQALNATIAKNRVLDNKCEVPSLVDDTDNINDYTYIPTKAHLSSCSNSIVAYIAGFVVHKLQKSLHCEACVDALNSSSDDSMHSLIKLKSKGNLIFPSPDVMEICVYCEKLFRQEITVLNKSDMLLSRKESCKLINSVLEYCTYKSVFSSLTDHMYESHPLDNHILLLIRSVAEKYLQVRYTYAGKQYTAKLQAKIKVKSRQTYTKLVLFSGQ